MRFVYLLTTAVIFTILPKVATGQTTSQTSFGKNRVQYHRHFDDWMQYETQNFITFWYGEARNVAQAALQTAEFEFTSIQQLLEHQMTDKIEMLVFVDLTDLKQSNIGEEDIFQLRAGETKVVGNKIFVYFDGNHQHLRTQIRQGVAGVVLNSMLFGANLQEIVQNAVLLNLPGWYTNGLLAYCGEEWSPEHDDRLRDIILSDRYETFDKLAKDHPEMAGHAFWYYISMHFGKGTVSNLLYLTRINRSIDVGFLYVLGSGYRRTTESMMSYFRMRYREEMRYVRQPEETAQIRIKNKRKLPFTQARLSPDGKRITWVSNDIGRWKVWVQDLETGKRTRVMRGGTRNAQQTTDLNYPIVRWHPDNQRLGILYERRDVLHLDLVDPANGDAEKSALAPDYQRVFSMDFINASDLVLSAAVKGYSDLFLYRTVTRQTERLTQDFWDDLDASVTVLDGVQGILFSSNRISDTLSPQQMDTILPVGNFDIFFYDLERRSPALLRLTDTRLYSERMPIGTDSSHFAYLTEESGIVNRKAGYLEPYVAYYKTVFYLKDGAEFSALNTRQQGEWPLEKALLLLAPEDTVRMNLDSALIDSVLVFPVEQKRSITYNQTNYAHNLLEHHSAQRSGKLLETHFRDDARHIYVQPYQPDNQSPAWITRFRELQLRSIGVAVPPQLIDQPLVSPGAPAVPMQQDTSTRMNLLARRDTSVRINPGWLFHVPEHLNAAPPAFTAPVAPQVQPEPEPEETLPVEPMRPIRPLRTPLAFGRTNEILRFYPSQIVPYRLRFRTDYIATSMDNNLLFEGLDSYAGSPDGFQVPPPGILLRANFKDMLEDYVVEAGFRLPITFNGAEYYLWMDNKKRRMDKRIALYRKTILNTVDRSTQANPVEPFQVRTNTLLGQYELRYPLNAYFSLRSMFTLRQDKAITLSTNIPTLETPDYSEQRASARLSAVFDNTVDVDINLRTGTRAKVFVEAVKRFELNTQPDLSLRFNSGFMTVVGLDARHYLRLDRRSILALRLAGATTFGSERILYFLGGVDNWIFPEFNNNIPVPQGGNFAYQTLAANLRGFQQNIRNGNSYALLNTELRIPIFKYLSNKPVLGNFWRNFQLVGFFDAGTAWQGRTPYTGDNPLNTIFLYNPPTVTVKVNYFRDPLVAGYGIGIRSMLFGMYMRVDYGWGIETRVVQKPLWHIALGTDF